MADLKIPTRNLDENFSLQDFQDDFNAINEELNDIAINISSYMFLVSNWQSPDADWTPAFDKAISDIKANGKGSIILPQGKEYNGNIYLNEAKRVIITGGGTLKGTIYLYGKDTSQEQYNDRFTNGSTDITIKDITIDGEKIRDGIHLKWVAGVNINNVTIKNCVYAAYFEKVDAVQHCSRIKITDCKINECNYGVYVDKNTTFDNFVVGDITLSNNIFEVRNSGFETAYQVYAKGLDGLVCIGNTFFMVHTSSFKKSNIYIEKFDWVTISNNNIFEAGEHAIHCFNGKDLLINNNNIAWTGKEGIRVNSVVNSNVISNNVNLGDDGGANILNKTSILIENCPFFIGNIAGNIINFANEYAVRLVDSSYVNITGNSARNRYSTNAPISLEGSSSAVSITGNHFTNWSKKLSSLMSNFVNRNINITGNYETGDNLITGVHIPSSLEVKYNQTSIDITDKNLVVLANTAATTITAVTTEDLSKSPPRTVTFYSYNANTTISNAIPGIVLADGQNTTIPAGGSITFLVWGGQLRELSRNFPLVAVKTVSTTVTTVDITGYNQVNLNQPSATTIASITGGTEGKEITLIAFNANTTIQYSSSMFIKGGVNASIPSGCTLSLRYTNNRWYEIGRSF